MSASVPAEDPVSITPLTRLLVAPGTEQSGKPDAPSITVRDLARTLFSEQFGFSVEWKPAEQAPDIVASGDGHAEQIAALRRRRLHDKSQFLTEQEAKVIFGPGALDPLPGMIAIAGDDGKMRYPVAQLKVAREYRQAIVDALAHLGDDVWTRVEFLTERHGALGGRDVAEAIDADLADKVIELARIYEPR